jgi:cold shock CspA family protein
LLSSDFEHEPAASFFGTISRLGDLHTSGTITPDDGSEPLAFHCSAIEASSAKGCRLGARVSFRKIENVNGGFNATAILVL